MHRQERMDSPHDMMLSAFEGMQSALWTALPGIVQDVNLAEMTCTVQAAIQVQVQKQDYSFEWVDLPPLIHVPLVFPSAGGCSITFPIAAGDEVLVIFASRCIDAWWQSGGYKNQQLDFRMHELSDGFALPGPRSLKRVVPSISTTEIQIRSDDGQAFISVDPTSHNIKVKTPANITAEAANLTATITTALSATCATASVQASSQATVQAPIINLTGNVVVSGSLTVAGAAALNGGVAVAGGGGNTAVINAPMTTTGTMTASGGLSVTGTMTNNGMAVGSTHTHTSTAPGSPTSPPL